MIYQPGDHYAPGDEGFTPARNRIAVRAYGASLGDTSLDEITMQAARTRCAKIGDAIAFVILSNQRATYNAAHSITIEHARRFEWPILIEAGIIVPAPRS